MEKQTKDNFLLLAFQEKSEYAKAFIGDLDKDEFMGVVTEKVGKNYRFEIRYKFVCNGEIERIQAFIDTNVIIAEYYSKVDNLPKNKYFKLKLHLLTSVRENVAFSVKVDSISLMDNNGSEQNNIKDYIKDELLINELKLTSDIAHYNDLKERCNNLNEKEKKLKKILFLHDLELLKNFDTAANIQDNSREPYVDIKDNIQHIQFYLAQKLKLYYEYETILNFYLGLQTNQIVILNGKPGSGKSKLVDGMAKAIGAKLINIPVQSNWMDKSDLLGYYNPMYNRYEATDFLEELIDGCCFAEKNPDKLCIVCLDEMNLAYAEYYFADFLVKLQTEKREVELYNKRLYKKQMNLLNIRYNHLYENLSERIEELHQNNGQIRLSELKGLVNDDEISGDSFVRLKELIDNVVRYLPVLRIPINVKFVATINKDETTKDLSPKVIDRSYFLRVESVSSLKNLRKRLENHLDYNKYDKIPLLLPLLLNDDNIENEKLDVWVDILAGLDIHISNRVYQELKKFNFDDVNLKDMFFSAFILPRVYIDLIEDDTSMENNLLRFFSENKMEYSQKIFSTMKTSDEITYWR